MTARLISLVRHGKVAGPAALYGHTDIALSHAGATALNHTLRQLHREQPIDLLTSSPLQRCLHTAQAFASAHDIALEISAEFTEMHFGQWDGVAFDQLNTQWPELENFWRNPSQMSPPGGETLDSFAARVIAAWQKILRQSRVQHQVIVCHGGVIRIIIAQILGLDFGNARLFQQLQLDYASHSRIQLANSATAEPVIQWLGARSQPLN